MKIGPWEQIFYGEFDGGRKKRVLVKIIGDEFFFSSKRLAGNPL